MTSQPTPLFAAVVSAGLSPSHGDARRLIRAGRIAVDGVVATDEMAVFDGDLGSISRVAPRSADALAGGA